MYHADFEYVFAICYQLQYGLGPSVLRIEVHEVKCNLKPHMPYGREGNEHKIPMFVTSLDNSRWQLLVYLHYCFLFLDMVLFADVSFKQNTALI